MNERKMISFKRIFLRLLSLSSLVLPVFNTVTETTQYYLCIEEFHDVKCDYAMNNSDCHQYWSAHDHSIGTFLDSVPECHSPCKELFLGRIVLDECVNITLAVICTREYLTEYRVHFYGIPQSPKPPPVESGWIGVFLSIALVTVLVVSATLCSAFVFKKHCSRSSLRRGTAEAFI